jgi:hypothetical protein
MAAPDDTTTIRTKFPHEFWRGNKNSNSFPNDDVFLLGSLCDVSLVVTGFYPQMNDH